MADNIFGSDIPLSVMTAWLGAVAYTLQIYFDFSGYSDMAIGLGKMFGFHFPENFNYPYVSRSATEFWRRWHISMGSWFRDYVYIPLGGNRVAKPRWIFNLFMVWALTGIWHGANWTFLCWGLFYFVLLLLEKVTGFAEKMGAFAHVYAMMAVIVGWAMFRAESITAGVGYIGMMFGIGSNGMADSLFYEYVQGSYVILLAAMLLCLPILPWVREKMVGQSFWAIV